MELICPHCQAKEAFPADANLQEGCVALCQRCASVLCYSREGRFEVMPHEEWTQLPLPMSIGIMVMRAKIMARNEHKAALN